MKTLYTNHIIHLSFTCMLCRNANTGIGLQERVVLEGVATNAIETGGDLPDDPVVRQMAEQMRKEKAVA